MKTLKRILFKSSHLSHYLPIMKQNLSAKITRIYSDQSYIQQNIGDSHLHLQIRNNWIYRLLFTQTNCTNPIENLLFIWYSLVVIAIIYSYAIIGIISVYGQVAWFDIYNTLSTYLIEIICLLIFACDIIVQLNVGYIHRGVIILQKSRVVSNYLHKFLILDILYVIILFITIVSQIYEVGILRILVFFKFFRMFQIDQLFLRKLSVKQWKIIYVIGKQFITIFVLAHTIGIIFYAIDYALTNDPICINDNSLCWLYSATTYSPIISYPWNIQYFYSLYWGVNVIGVIGYGDISPNNPIQTSYATFCFIFGFVVYRYILSKIVGAIIAEGAVKKDLKQQLIVYTTFMDNLRINKEVQYNIRDYLEHQFIQENERDQNVQEEMKQKLPQELRKQILKGAYLTLHHSLQQMLFSSPSITKLLYSLKQKKYAENEVILEQGVFVDNLYYLHQGQIVLTHHYRITSEQIKEISGRNVFLGHYEFLVNQKSTYEITAKKTSTVYYMARDQISQKISQFTDLRQNFKHLEYEVRMNYDYKRILYSCFYCEGNHHWYECMNVFPNFFNTNLTKYQLKQNDDQKRYSKACYQTLKNIASLKQVRMINENPIFVKLQQLKERIYRLRKMKNAKRQQFEIDIKYDWIYYCPQKNFSNYKLGWNKLKQQRMEKQKQARQYYEVVEAPPLPQFQL